MRHIFRVRPRRMPTWPAVRVTAWRRLLVNRVACADGVATLDGSPPGLSSDGSQPKLTTWCTIGRLGRSG